jgi:hypothetical protein
MAHGMWLPGFLASWLPGFLASWLPGFLADPWLPGWLAESRALMPLMLLRQRTSSAASLAVVLSARAPRRLVLQARTCGSRSTSSSSGWSSACCLVGAGGQSRLLAMVTSASAAGTACACLGLHSGVTSLEAQEGAGPGLGVVSCDAGSRAAATAPPYNPAEPPTSRLEGDGALDGKLDPYGGVNVDPEGLPSDPHVFALQLRASLQRWAADQRRGIWLKVPIEQAALIPVAVDEGQFVFHHAEPDYVMLTRWLPDGEPNPLPANASTQVGVGALVVNERGQVLLVQEKVGPTAGRNIWKIPTGLLEAREDIAEVRPAGHRRHDGAYKE